MSNSPMVSYVKISPNKNIGRVHPKYNPKGVIDIITIHHMAGCISIETCGNVFYPSSRQASSNYGIGSDGRVALYVDEKDRSWCSSSPANDYRAVTIEVANSSMGGDWPVSDAALKALVNLCVDICKRNGFKLTYDGTPNGSLTRHNMFAATSCPGPYLQSKFPWIVEQVNARLGEANTGSTPAAAKSNEQIANEVIAGKWGNGNDRKSRLTSAGYNYSTIQAIVNQKLGAKPAAKPKPKPIKKSNDVIASEVLAGKWGNGTDRKNRITAAGYDYNTIQALVNKKVGSKPKTATPKKSNNQIANEVIAGKWGNGADRKRRLVAAGYSYSTIQALVNKKLR